MTVETSHDLDPVETQEWIEALNAILTHEGVDRAHFLLECLIDEARRNGAYLPHSANTAYRIRMAFAFLYSLECNGDGRASQS